jgi:hypothetical protein
MDFRREVANLIKDSVRKQAIPSLSQVDQHKQSALAGYRRKGSSNKVRHYRETLGSGLSLGAGYRRPVRKVRRGGIDLRGIIRSNAQTGSYAPNDYTMDIYDDQLVGGRRKRISKVMKKTPKQKVMKSKKLKKKKQPSQLIPYITASKALSGFGLNREEFNELKRELAGLYDKSMSKRQNLINLRKIASELQGVQLDQMPVEDMMISPHQAIEDFPAFYEYSESVQPPVGQYYDAFPHQEAEAYEEPHLDEGDKAEYLDEDDDYHLNNLYGDENDQLVGGRRRRVGRPRKIGAKKRMPRIKATPANKRAYKLGGDLGDMLIGGAKQPKGALAALLSGLDARVNVK